MKFVGITIEIEHINRKVGRCQELALALIYRREICLFQLQARVTPRPTVISSASARRQPVNVSFPSVEQSINAEPVSRRPRTPSEQHVFSPSRSPASN